MQDNLETNPMWRDSSPEKLICLKGMLTRAHMPRETKPLRRGGGAIIFKAAVIQSFSLCFVSWVERSPFSAVKVKSFRPPFRAQSSSYLSEASLPSTRHLSQPNPHLPPHLCKSAPLTQYTRDRVRWILTCWQNIAAPEAHLCDVCATKWIVPCLAGTLISRISVSACFRENRVANHTSGVCRKKLLLWLPSTDWLAKRQSLTHPQSKNFPFC